MRIHIPTAEEFDAALRATSNISPAILGPVVQRDIARMIEIAHLVEDVHFLDSDVVLSGGVAMRLRGSSRVSKMDTDVSATPKKDLPDGDILDALEMDGPPIELRPPRRLERSPAGDVRKAFPVVFRFDEPPAPVDDSDRCFRVDIAARGLELEPERLELRHEYPFCIGIEGIKVPTVALIEAVAEKAFSYGVFNLAKHYADLAFAVDHFEDDLTAEQQVLRAVTRAKLSRNLQQFPGLMQKHRVRDYDSLKPAFVQDNYLRVVKRNWNADVGYVGEASEHYTFDRALELVRTRLVPLLF